MRNLIFIVLFLTSYLGNTQEIIYKKFNSIELGVARTLKIYVPPSYAKEINRFYPLTILLDGDVLFDVYLGNAKLFSHGDLAPEQIIVGIYQNEANERFSDCSVDKVTGLPTEESDRFYRFIGMELLEFLETNYRLSPFRTIVGNTNTANFINFFILEKELPFDAFVNINPYYNPEMSNFLEMKIASLNGGMLYYYVNSGKYNKVEIHKNIEKVAYSLKNMDLPNVKVKYDIFDNSNKTSSIGQAIPGALAHIFSGYAYISPEEFESNIKYLEPQEAIDYLKKKYIEIEYLFGTNLKIRERDIYAIESIIIDQENGRYLSEFGKMIEGLYPESPLSDYYIGMYFELQGKYSHALKNYKVGYAKMDNNSTNAEAYYQNIERVKGRADEVIELKEQEKGERDAKKEEWKEQKRAEKEMQEQYRKKDK